MIAKQLILNDAKLVYPVKNKYQALSEGVLGITFMKSPIHNGTTTIQKNTVPQRKMKHEINNRLNTLHLGITLMCEWDDPELQRLGKILRLEIESLEAMLKTTLG